MPHFRFRDFGTTHLICLYCLLSAVQCEPDSTPAYHLINLCIFQFFLYTLCDYCTSGCLTTLLSQCFSITQPQSRSFHNPEPLYSPPQYVCLLPGICVVLQWLVSDAEVVLWPWQDTQTHTCPTPNSTHTLGLFHQTSTVSSAPLSILLHVHFLLPFPACSAVKTAVKHSLISPVISKGNPNEKILATFSLSCHAAHHKC